MQQNPPGGQAEDTQIMGVKELKLHDAETKDIDVCQKVT